MRVFLIGAVLATISVQAMEPEMAENSRIVEVNGKLEVRNPPVLTQEEATAACHNLAEAAAIAQQVRKSSQMQSKKSSKSRSSHNQGVCEEAPPFNGERRPILCVEKAQLHPRNSKKSFG